MRVLITTDAVGGVWTFTRELTIGLLRAGCAVSLACIGPAPQAAQLAWTKSIEAHAGDRFRFAHIDAPLEWEQANATALSAALVPLRRLADDFRADLLHSNQFCFGVLADSLPTVVTAHSDVLSWFGCCSAGRLPENAWLRRYRALVNDGLRHASAVTAPTRWMRNALLQKFPLAVADDAGSPSVFVVPNGRTLPRRDEQPRVLRAVTAGRLWDKAKNIGILAEITAGMPLLIAGDTAYEGASVPPAVGHATMLGRLTEEELLALLRTSAAYICTSRYEPFGLAPLEAALCGCALLCNDLPSLREVWADAALYYRDGATLNELLAKLSHNPALLARTAARCLERAQRYTGRAMTARYLELYRSTTAALQAAALRASTPGGAQREEARAA